jgi:hypothetical protein
VPWAAELSAGHSEQVAQHPEKRRVSIDIDGVIQSMPQPMAV